MKIQETQTRVRISEVVNGTHPDLWGSLESFGLERVHGSFSGDCREYAIKTCLNLDWFNSSLTVTSSLLYQKGLNDFEEPQEMDLVCYLPRKYRDDMFAHFGVWKNGKVESKFGLGHVYRHKVDEVPLSYGDEAFFFRKL